MSSPNPAVTVVIPHLNQPGALETCLDSLDAQSIDRSAIEVIVVDNGSDSLPDLSSRSNVQLLEEPKPGPGLARNRGVEAARGDLLCFIDADCRADSRWLECAAAVLAAAPPSTVIGGDVRIWRNNPARYGAIEAYESVFAYRFKMYIEKQGYSGTGNLAVRRADFAKVGPFRGLEVAEDVDWGRRARASGMTIRYEPGMVVYHPARATLRELFVKWDRHLHHELAAERVKRWWRIRWLCRAGMVLASPLVDAGKVLTSDRLTGWSARVKAIGVLVAVRSYRAWRMLGMMISTKEIVWNRSAKVDPVARVD
jgi:GT2 family glycosyltransferase